MTSNDATKIIKAVLIITIFSVVTRALGFVFRIYMSWELGAEILGIYQVAYSIVGVLVVLVSSGLPLALSKQTAKYAIQKNINRAEASTSATLIISLVLSTLICILIFVFQTPIGKIFADERCLILLLVLLPTAIFSAIYSSFRGSLWGQKRYFIVGLVEFIEQIFRIAFFIILVIFIDDKMNNAINAGVSLSIACLGSALVTAIIYFMLGNKLKNPKREYAPILKSSSPVTGVRVATSLIQPLIAIIIPLQLMVSGMSSSDAMSEFGIAVGMTLPLLFLPSTLVGSLAMVLLPELSSTLEKRDLKSANMQVQSAFTFTIFVSMIIVPLYMGMSEGIGLFVYNNARAGYYLLISAWMMLPIALSNISSTVLNAMGLEGKSFINYLIGSMFLIISIAFLTKYIGIASLIVGMGGCLTISSVLNIIMMHRKEKLKTDVLKNSCIMAIFAIPCVFISQWSFNLTSLFFTKFFSLAIGSIVGAIFFIVLCLLFKIVDIRNLYNSFIKRKIKQRA